jgi:hypothetical protein
LQKHVTLKHNERYEYQCNECEFKSKDLNAIKRHMLKFHIVSSGPFFGQKFLNFLDLNENFNYRVVKVHIW